MIIKIENTRTNERAVLSGMMIPHNANIKIGDEFTIHGVHTAVPNVSRRWWQFWKPRWVIGPLQKYRVLGVGDGKA